MPRRPRLDAPDTWHHVLNRGIARRTVFESRTDVRKFLSLVAREVRRGAIELHAYCVMATHFHMLVRSPDGRLSAAMQRVGDLFARRFNRTRRRDGPLFRGRFRSIPVRSNAHWAAALAYIDRNPVDARIVATPSAYPWGSAHHYARGNGPRWLTRSRVEALVCDRGCLGSFEPARYDAVVNAAAADVVAVELSLRGRVLVPDDLDDLVSGAPDRVRAWMRRKAVLADGTARRAIVVSAATVREAIAGATALRPDWTVRIGPKRRSAWAAMRAGLLRALAGARLRDVAEWEGIAVSSAARRQGWHRRAMRDDPEYAEATARVAEEATKKR